MHVDQRMARTVASYRARAVAIHDLVVHLRRDLERYVDSTPANKAVMISVAVETTNKLLYCFLVSQEMFDQIDDLLNDHLDVAAEPQPITALYLRTLNVVRRLENHTHAWVVKYS